jgi:hypothetical protein
VGLSVVIGELDSPIEKRLSGPLVQAVAPFVRDHDVHLTLTSQWVVPLMFTSTRATKRGLAKSSPYRVDLMLEAAHDRSISRLAVECDGAANHGFWDWENDDVRERRISGATGAVFVRYTGKQIFADASGCAEHAVRCLREIVAHGRHARLPALGQQVSDEQALELARSFLERLREK